MKLVAPKICKLLSSRNGLSLIRCPGALALLRLVCHLALQPIRPNPLGRCRSTEGLLKAIAKVGRPALSQWI